MILVHERHGCLLDLIVRSCPGGKRCQASRAGEESSKVATHLWLVVHNVARLLEGVEQPVDLCAVVHSTTHPHPENRPGIARDLSRW